MSRLPFKLESGSGIFYFFIFLLFFYFFITKKIIFDEGRHQKIVKKPLLLKKMNHLIESKVLDVLDGETRFKAKP
jgi:hypothetical protein